MTISLAVLISGSGTTLEKLVHKAQQAEIAQREQHTAHDDRRGE